jgi:hypothetical protein
MLKTSPHSGALPMVQITYRIVEHDGGWAYRLGDTFSETYPDHDSARAAAAAAAREQKVPDEDALIEYADASGRWITERADGHDRPETEVEG